MSDLRQNPVGRGGRSCRQAGDDISQPAWAERKSGYRCNGEREMLDAIMLIFGAGMFVCFFAYTAICDKI